MKVGIYCRVSSDEQASKGISIRDQEKRGIEYCESNGYEYELFIDAGYSGTLDLTKRPRLDALMDLVYAKPKEIDAIFVTDYDRLSRNVELGFLIKRDLINSGVILIENGVQIDLKDESQELLVSLKNLISAHEVKKLSSRLKRTLERNVMDGKVGGGYLYNYGYKKDQNKKMVIDDYEAKIVRRIFNTYIDGVSTKKIAVSLNNDNIPTKRMRMKDGSLMVKNKRKGDSEKIRQTQFKWSQTVVLSMLKNTVYKGERPYKGKTYPCPPIIDADIFDLVQKKLKQANNFKNTNNKHFYLLKGLMKCGFCGSTIYGRKKSNLSDNYYACASKIKGGKCDNKGIGIDYLNDVVWKSIINLPIDIENLVIKNKALYKDRLADNIKEIEEKIAKNNNRINRYLELFVDGEEEKEITQKKISEINEKNKELKELLRLRKMEDSLFTNYSEILNNLKHQIKYFTKIKDHNELTQKLIRTYIVSILIRWIPKANTHIIWIEYKLSNETNLKFQSAMKVKVKKNGWRYSPEDIVYRFRRITPKFSILKGKNGESNTTILNENEEIFNVRLYDQKFNSKTILE
jgi:site-specific DNA recombinase